MFLVELWGTPWLFFHSLLPLQGARVLFLVREQDPTGSASRPKKKKENLWRVQKDIHRKRNKSQEKNLYAGKIKTIPREIVDIQGQTQLR